MKVGIIGYGRRALYFIEQAKKKKDDIIVFSQHHPIQMNDELTIFSGMSDLCNQKLDAAIITSADSQHFEQAAALIKQRIPVLIEKPAATSVTLVKSLTEIAHKYKTPVYVGYNYRTCPIYQQVKNMRVDINDVVNINCFILADIFDNLTQTDRLFFNVGCHYIDAINHIFDYPVWHVCNSVMCKKRNRDKSGQINVLLNNDVPLNISFNFQALCFPEVFESSIFIQTKTNTIILTRNGLKIIEGHKIKECNNAQTPIYEEFCKNIELRKNSCLCTLEEDMVNLQIIECIYNNTRYIGGEK